MTTESLKPKPRLKFIDIARSWAIVMMLEGHCTGEALADQYRTAEYPLFDMWYRFHGLTSVLFFTISGLIFAYLLTQDNSIPYWQNERVKKGFKRVGELMFWGYAVQLDLKTLYNQLFNGGYYIMDWAAAFHVLQCIGAGILFLLLLYGLYKWLKWGKLEWYYFIGGMLLFAAQAWFNRYIQWDKSAVESGVQAGFNYLPTGAPSFIQNMFYGEYSQFAITRYSGYVLLGGMMGVIFRRNEYRIFENKIIFGLIALGFVMHQWIAKVIVKVDGILVYWNLTKAKYHETNISAFKDFGLILMFIGLLMLLDKHVKFKDNLFLKMGRNTFPIYVVHVIVLVGGLFGIGLKPHLLHHNLGPWATVLASLSFILTFALMTYFIEPLDKFYSTVLSYLLPWKWKSRKKKIASS